MIGLERMLRKIYLHGHPDFNKMCIEEMELHSAKNHDFARVGNPLGNFDRVSTIMSIYPNMKWDTPEGVALVYMLKQLDATLEMLSEGYEGDIEGVDKRLQDVGVYAKLIRILYANPPTNSSHSS